MQKVSTKRLEYLFPLAVALAALSQTVVGVCTVYVLTKIHGVWPGLLMTISSVISLNASIAAMSLIMQAIINIDHPRSDDHDQRLQS